MPGTLGHVGDAVDVPARLHLVRWATLLAALLATNGLAGWWIGSWTATGIRPSLPPMVPNTAIALLALSASVWLAANAPASRRCRLGAIAAGAVAGLIAGLTLAEYISGWDLWIDRLLLPTAPLAGRPSINTGVAVMGLVLSLSLRDARSRRVRRTGEALTWLAVASAFVAVVGYVYGVPTLYGVPDYLPNTGMAVTTAVALLLLGLSVLLVYPDSPVYRLAVSRSLGGTVARRLAATAFILPLVGLVTQAGVRWEFFRPEVGTAILVTTATALGALVVLALGRRLDAADVAQREALAHALRVTTLGELVASLSHELNQPLTAIIANAQAARRLGDAPGRRDADVREAFDDIVSDGQRASAIIQRLRALFRKDHAERKSIHVNELVTEVIGLVSSDAARRGAVIELDLAADLPPVTGDWVQLQQVVLNLLVNALEAMTTVEPPRTVTVTTARAEARRVVLTVCDRGVGVEASRVATIFDAFVSTKPEGLGMGLAISARSCWLTGDASGPRPTPTAGSPCTSIYRVTGRFTLHQFLDAGLVRRTRAESAK